MSVIAFGIAAIIFAALALGAHIGHGVEWGLCAISVGLLLGALGLGAFVLPRRTR